jgi:hypothetical protein
MRYLNLCSEHGTSGSLAAGGFHGEKGKVKKVLNCPKREEGLSGAKVTKLRYPHLGEGSSTGEICRAL